MSVEISPNSPDRRGKTPKRIRRPLPPLDTRDWMTAQETALRLGCSVATVHRLRRGLIVGTAPLPCNQYGRKVIFRKIPVAQWEQQNEKKVSAQC